MLARRAALVPAGIGVAGLLSGLASAQGASPVTEQTDTLFAIVLVIAILMGIVVYGTLVIAMVRFRAGRSVGAPNPSVSNRRLETAWSAVPALLLIGLTIISTQTLVFIDTNPKNALQIHVFAQQWSWEFQYPDNTSSSDLWIERGVTFLFNITSRDVIHSFYLPEFEIKKDAIPGIYNTLWLRADRSGRFHTQCAEYCGLGHSSMIASVIVFDPEPGRKPYGPPPSAPRPPDLKDVFLEEANGTPWRVVPATLNLTLGQYVELRVWNNGSAAHLFMIDAPYNEATGDIPPSSYGALFLNATQPTDATTYGGNASDRANGMVGTLVVAGGRIIDLNLSGGQNTPYRIEPKEVTVSLGETVIFRIHNVGDADHNFSLGKPFNVKYDPFIPPGGVVSLPPVTLNQDATATYICAIPGHAQLGMTGTLIVGHPQNGTGPVTYPFFGFALATSLIVGIAGFGYVVHHAVAGRGRGGTGRRSGPPK